MPEFMYQFVRLITKNTPSQTQITKCILSLRYHHRQSWQLSQVSLMLVRIQLSSIIQLSVLLLHCDNLNYQKQVNFPTIELLLKRLLLQADFFFILIIYSKLLPLLVWAHSKTPQEIDKVLGPAFRQITKPLARSNSSRPIVNQQTARIINEQLQLLQDLNSKNFFLFFFELINGKNEQGENNIDFYFLQLQNMEQQRLISSSQLQIIKNNFYLQYAKLRKRKYQEQAINYLYKWLQNELQLMFYQTNAQDLCIQTFNHIIRSHSNICGATLLQVIDTSVQNITPTKMECLLEVIDTCIIQGTYKISTQAILFVVCTIFIKIHLKKLKIKFDLIIEHLLLWKIVSTRRKLPHKLLTCFIEWIPLLYELTSPVIPNQPEILQLYRKQLLTLENQDEMSQISGLIMIVQQLQIRKIQTVYEQLQEFHQKMDNSKLSLKPNKSVKSDRILFSYNISKLNKSNSQINSLLNDLQSKMSMVQAHSKHIQLQLLSKSNSMSGYGSMKEDSSRSLGEFVEIIMSLIDLFDYNVIKQASISLQEEDRTISRREQFDPNQSSHSNILPIVSQLEHLFTKKQTSNKQSNRFEELPIKNVKINFCAKDQDSKKRMAKNRGLVVKTQVYEIGYLLQGKRSLLSLFITFFKPIKTFALRFQQNSFKCKESKTYKLSQLKVDKQYNVQFQVQRIKLYQQQGLKDSQRVVKSKIKVKIEEHKHMLQEVYYIPISIFNLIEWRPIQTQDLSAFQEQALLQTQWLPACPKFIKNGPNYLKRFILFSQDQKGNYLIKAKLFSQIIFVILIPVIGDVKIKVMNNKSWLLCVGLMQVIG